MPTTSEIEAAAALAATEPTSTSVDGESVNNLDPLVALDVADRLASRQALAGTNSSGRRRSAWRYLRQAVFSPRSGR